MPEIRIIGREELSIVRDIVYKTWPDTYGDILSAVQIDYMLDRFYNLEYLEASMDKGQEYYICFEAGIPLGFIGVQPGLEPDSLKLHKLYVLPGSQGKSIGKKLFQKAEEITRNHRLSRIYLNVNRFNKAIEFYKAMGLEVSREEDIDIGNGYLMEDFVMEKIIEIK